MSATTEKAPATLLTLPSDREIAITRTFDAPRRLVWDVFTRPEHVSRWMLGPENWTMPVCEIDLRPGGAWRYVWRKSSGTEMEMRGEYREIAPPERTVRTECWGAEWPETLNTLHLSEAGGRTTVTETILYPTREARDAALQTGMMDGANRSFDRLDALLRALA